MPFNKKESDRKYYLKNKEKIQQYHKQYREKNSENLTQKSKDYYEKNKEKRKEYQKSPAGRKVTRIFDWKKRGVISNNFNELYEYYLSVNNCQECNCILDECNKSRKCLDHNHLTGEFRNVLCQSCNIKRG